MQRFNLRRRTATCEQKPSHRQPPASFIRTKTSVYLKSTRSPHQHCLPVARRFPLVMLTSITSLFTERTDPAKTASPDGRPNDEHDAATERPHINTSGPLNVTPAPPKMGNMEGPSPANPSRWVCPRRD